MGKNALISVTEEPNNMTKLSALTRRQTTLTVTLALALTTAASVALATPPQSKAPARTDASADQRGPGRGAHDPFARWDTDHDGKIVLKDLPARAQTHLTTVDANKDGVLTREEFDKGREQLRAQRMKDIDTNKDGKVSDEERSAHRQAMVTERFTADDKNHDGYLTRDEVPKMWEHLKKADANNDSNVTLAELQVAFASGKMAPPDRNGKQGQCHGHGQGHGPRR
jgi:Ca2+-binding EF-hand superfamily protein